MNSPSPPSQPSDLGVDLQSVLAQLPIGVAVVSTRAADGSPLGTTVSTVTAVSSDPPKLVVSLAAGSSTLDALRESGEFMVNVLSEHQRAISSRFAGERSASMATGLELIGEDAKSPHVAEAIAYLRCKLDSCVALGERQFVVGLVTGVHAARPELGPLLYFRGGYSRLQGEGGATGVAASGPPAAPRRYSELPSVAIVGGGFSGAITAARLLAEPPEGGLRVVLVERGSRTGPGLAYSTPSLAHRLNVPAAQMSAFAEQPDHFLRWARRRDASVGAGSFVPRFLYGEYLESALADAERDAAPGVELERVRDEAVGLVATELPDRRLRLALRSGREIVVDRLVLASGNATPADAPGATAELLASDRYVADPWFPDLAAEEDERGPVLLLGTGLTMIDAALTLGAGGGPELIAVSRNGLLPRRHPGIDGIQVQPPAPEWRAQELRDRLIDFLVDAMADEETGGRRAADALRPFTNRVWAELPETERRWFIAKLARLWEVHRHRMAPEVAMALDAMRDSGRLRVVAGSVERVAPTADGVEMRLRLRGSDAVETIEATRLINCSGPALDLARTRDPLLADLAAQGLIRADALRLGIEMDEDGAVRDADGRSSGSIYAIGALRKGLLWETTAVRELRVQAADLARTLAATPIRRAPGARAAS